MSTGTRYVEISESAMREMLEGEMGFVQVRLDGTTELVFERQVETKGGRTFPYKVRVYSSIAYGQSRGVGEDAIRVVLVDMETNRPMKVLGEGKQGKAGRRIYRTKSALPNLRERCRDYFRHVMANPCPECGSVMAVRKGPRGPFLGCTNFPECRGTKEIEVEDSKPAPQPRQQTREEYINEMAGGTRERPRHRRTA